MICPRCKNKIEEKSLRCNICGARVGALCKDCGQYNPINSLKCSNCGKELLRLCNDCGSANHANAKLCRKCGAELNKNLKSKAPELSYTGNSNSQQKIKTKLVEGIKDADSKIITLSGASGSGKNLVLRYAISELSSAKLIWLMGTCSQITQLSPFGYFQDLLLNFFNINNFCPDTLQLKKNSIKFFKQDFPTLTHEEILDLLNLLYPDITDRYENIYYNKSKMFVLMKKVIKTIIEKMKIVFIIDKFENIDGMSYDFIKELLNEDFTSNRCKFILICTEPKPGRGILTAPNLEDANYLDLNIAPFTKTQIAEFLKQYKEPFDKNFIQTAEKISEGLPAYIEQLVFLKKTSAGVIDEFNFNNIEALTEIRLKLLKQSNLKAYRTLLALSILGPKFYPSILNNFDNNSPAELDEIIEYLVNNGFITQINNLSFEFKTSSIWKIIVNFGKTDSSFDEILNTVYDIIKSYKQSSIALAGYILQKLEDNTKAFEVWTTLMKLASYVGDIGLYIIVQKQALKLIENKNNDFYKKVKKNIYTRVGKLLEPIDPAASFNYLQNAIILLDDNEIAKHIELLGYISSCLMKTGNYYGVIECAENVISKITEDLPLEKILIRTRTINPLLKLGNYGELINITETELMPEIEKYLTKGKDVEQISIKDLFEIWLNLYFDLAEALIFQGNNKAFEIIQTIYEIIEKNQFTEPQYLCKTNLLLALANTIKGDVNTSKQILNDILKEYSIDSMDSFIVSRWNFTDILNKFIAKDYETLQTELFNVASYANNVNDNFTKNILKTILAKILKNSGQTKKALEILEEQVSYFAKEKVATGVLLCWYLIAELKLVTNGTQFALDIANKALDVVQGTNINNYYFIALFNKLIGEIYVAKQDFDSAKVYFEKSLFIAKQFDLEFIQVKTYLQCAKLYQELALPKSNSRNKYIKQALKMFQSAKNIPIVSTNPYLQKEIKEDLNILTSFCKLNGLILKREQN